MQIDLKQEITLRPELELELQQTAETLLDLNAQKAMVELQLTGEKDKLKSLQKEVGQDKFVVGDFKFALTKAGGSSLSEAILLAVGVTPAQIAAAKKYAATIPKEKYVRVTRKSDKEVTEND